MPKSMSAGSIRTKSGVVLDKADLDLLAVQAADMDLTGWKPRPVRPSLSANKGAIEHSTRIDVRVPQALHRRVVDRAAREGMTTDPNQTYTQQVIAGLRIELANLEVDGDTPAFAEKVVRANLEGLLAFLVELGDRPNGWSHEVVNEVARAYLVGRRDVAGDLGGTTRRILWPCLERAGLDF